MQTASTVVDLKPIVDQVVLPTLVAILSAGVPCVVGWAVYWINRLFHIQVSAKTALQVDAALDRAITYGQHQAQTVIDAHSNVDVKNAVIASAVNYASPKLQGEMKTLGWDPNTLAQRIKARLPLAPDSPGIGTITISPAAPAAAPAEIAP